MKHGCHCLEIIRQKLMERHGPDADVELDLKHVVSIAEADFGAMSLRLPPLYYRYRQGRKRKKSFVDFNYCPFCGKRN